MEIVYKKSFIREFTRLPTNIQTATQSVLNKLERADTLEAAGVDYAHIRGQKTGYGYYRIRIGQYRMGIEYVAPNLIVITIGVKGDIYKTFPPK
jgi:mRNA interferase RelE/StbE